MGTRPSLSGSARAPRREWREYSYRFYERQGGPRDHQRQDDASVEICYSESWMRCRLDSCNQNDHDHLDTVGLHDRQTPVTPTNWGFASFQNHKNTLVRRHSDFEAEGHTRRYERTAGKEGSHSTAVNFSIRQLSSFSIPAHRLIYNEAASKLMLDHLGPRRAANLIASTMLSSLATPFPAISKAVPWSTLVRIIGSPTVTFTPSSK